MKFLGICLMTFPLLSVGAVRHRHKRGSWNRGSVCSPGGIDRDQYRAIDCRWGPGCLAG